MSGKALIIGGEQTGRVKHKSGECLYIFEIDVKLHLRVVLAGDEPNFGDYAD